MAFVVLPGVVSLVVDMTYEEARDNNPRGGIQAVPDFTVPPRAPCRASVRGVVGEKRQELPIAA